MLDAPEMPPFQRNELESSIRKEARIRFKSRSLPIEDSKELSRWIAERREYSPIPEKANTCPLKERGSYQLIEGILAATAVALSLMHLYDVVNHYIFQ